LITTIEPVLLAGIAKSIQDYLGAPTISYFRIRAGNIVGAGEERGAVAARIVRMRGDESTLRRGRLPPP
jgi:hypothetical protein